MIVTLTGPSCAGKTTLEAMLVERGLARAISTTTRPVRADDIANDSYYFTTRPAFEQGVHDGGFVEHVEFGGNYYYGLSVAEVERLSKLGKPIVVVREPIGQKQIAAWCKANNFPLFAVFVDNPEQVVAQRFLERLANDTWGMCDGDIKATTATYARRLKEMMTTERGWVAEAWSGNNYNLRLSTFGESNDEWIADVIGDSTYGRKEEVFA